MLSGSLEELKVKVREIAEKTGKEAGVEAGIEAARNIDIEAIVAEVVGAATTAAEEQALEIKAFETMSSDIAKESGKASGKVRRSHCLRLCSPNMISLYRCPARLLGPSGSR